jgi:integrase
MREALPVATGGKGAALKAKKSARKREASSVRTTLNGILRNAAAMFSKSLLTGYQLRGLTLENPFAGTKLKRIPIKAHAPFPRELIESIWKSATLLRDGDPESPAPTYVGGRRSVNSINFREPHPDAYAILLLELGLGLRRNEADKAEWSWVIEMPDGRRFLQVRATDIFIPKSKQSRVIPIDPLVWDELLAVKADNRFIVPAPKPKAKRKPEAKSSVYRNEEAHRVLVHWLKKMGVEDSKPCHALRKEFGSYVATTFSLFHAQKLLGHSTPAVTSAYYASLTDLPELQPTRMGQSKQ